MPKFGQEYRAGRRMSKYVSYIIVSVFPRGTDCLISLVKLRGFKANSIQYD